MNLRRTFATPLLLAALLARAAPLGAQPAEPPKAPPSAEAVEDAAQRFQRGLELYKEGDYKAAQVEFKRAYEIAPNYRVFYNLGQVSYQLKDYASALKSFQAYLEQGGRDVPPARRTQLTAEIGRLRARVGTLVVEADVPGADVNVDDVWVGRTPLSEPVLVSAGQHKVAALKPGAAAPIVRTVEVGGGDKVELKFELGPLTPTPEATAPAPAPTPAPTPAPPPPPPPENKLPTYVAWGATGLFAASTVVAAVLTGRKEDSLDRQRREVPVSRDELEDARKGVRTLAFATDALGVATLLAGGVATYLTLRPGSKPQSGAASSQQAFSPRVGVGFGAISLEAKF
jgi:Tfp pilus assembly protein PilF